MAKNENRNEKQNKINADNIILLKNTKKRAFLMMPNSEILEEIPKGHKNNCIIVR